jgi:hypothetical protein
MPLEHQEPPSPSSSLDLDEAAIYIDQHIPYKFGVESSELDHLEDQQPDVAAVSWNSVRIHPLLEEYRTYQRPRTGNGNNHPLV